MTPGSSGGPHHRLSRRAVLFGGAGLAAAGAAAAVTSISVNSGRRQGEAAGEDTARASSHASAPAAVTVSSLNDRQREAAHFLRRAGFGGSMAEIDEFAALDREARADRLLAYERVDDAEAEERAAALVTFDEGGDIRPGDLQRWWLTRMSLTRRPLQERMTFAWHGLFTTQISKLGPRFARQALPQNELYRAMALARFDDLVQAMAKDPAMMVYLDTVESTAAHPNENFARELLELFTMGVGHYTEDDVREAARAFTGWRLTPPERPPATARSMDEPARRQALRDAAAAYQPKFVLAPALHDGGQKTFLGQAGPWGGEDIIDVIMAHPETGRFITARLFREFVHDHPAPATIDALLATWDGDDHSIAALVRAILVSDEMYAVEAYRSKIRSPAELIVGLVRGLELELRGGALGGQAGGDGYYRAMDQVLFEPPNVAGWPGGAAWLNSGTFFARLNVLDALLFPRGRPLPIPALEAVSTPDALVTSAAERLVDGTLSDGAREAISAHLATISDIATRRATAAFLVAGSPEFQLI